MANGRSIAVSRAYAGLFCALVAMLTRSHRWRWRAICLVAGHPD
jgi:hypothetical protein